MKLDKAVEFLLESQRNTAEQLQSVLDRQSRSEDTLHALMEQQRALVHIVAQQQQQLSEMLKVIGALGEGQKTLTEAHGGLTDAQKKGLEQLFTMAQHVESLARAVEEWIRMAGGGIRYSRPN